jgi:ABC-type transport system substrate-binding protein
MLFRFKYKLLAITLASVMVLALACGGDEDAAPAAPAPTTAPIAVATKAPTPVPAVAAATAAPVVAVATAAPEVVAQHFIMAQGDEPNTMYCGETTAVPAVMFGKAFCDNPIDFIQDELVGMMVVAWEANADSTEWTYQLREGVNFHDGDPFNAEALAAHHRFIMSSEATLGQWNRGIYGRMIESVEVLGEYEMRLHMKKPSPIWPLDETWWAGGVANQKALDAVGVDTFRSEGMIGAGAYILDEWVRLEEVTMHANRDWYRPEVSKIPETVSVKNIPEPATRLAALLTDEIQWLINPLSPQIEIINASPNHRALIKEQYDVNMLRFNWNRQPVLREKRLRQAISEAIDRETITKEIFLGTAGVLRNHLPTTSKYYDPNAPLFPHYDPENAKRLVAELKAEGLYNDEPIGFMGPRGTYNEDVRVNQAVTAYLQEVGINGVSEIVDLTIRAERNANKACDWDLALWLPVDGYGDMQGYLWGQVGGDPGKGNWCFTETPPGGVDGDWGDPDLNEWMRLGALAEVMPVGPERDATWLEALGHLNDAYIHQGLFQISFVYGVSNEWDFLPDSHEATFIWQVSKR